MSEVASTEVVPAVSTESVAAKVEVRAEILSAKVEFLKSEKAKKIIDSIKKLQVSIDKKKTQIKNGIIAACKKAVKSPRAKKEELDSVLSSIDEDIKNS